MLNRFGLPGFDVLFVTGLTETYRCAIKFGIRKDLPDRSALHLPARAEQTAKLTAVRIVTSRTVAVDKRFVRRFGCRIARCIVAIRADCGALLEKQGLIGCLMRTVTGQAIIDNFMFV